MYYLLILKDGMNVQIKVTIATKMPLLVLKISIFATEDVFQVL